MYQVLDVCRHIINYSNQKGYGVSNLKLQKLLYFVQAYFLMQTQQPCFEEEIVAWNFGPVIPVAYREYKQFGSCNIPDVKQVIEDADTIWGIRILPYCDNIIADADKDRIDQVVDKFAEYSSTDLVTLTQHQSPWQDVYVPDTEHIIHHHALRQYFHIQ